jgi:UDP-N-acetylglucosamine--N-acetylmuramyl-(pentapeptide) pyrophosphoryl-undecaprenol N-acetylglucosamine transferase
MRVLMTGGGTGGHVYPALAIAEMIQSNCPGSEIAFVGTEKGIENRLVPKAGYPLYHIQIQGIRRSLSPANLKTAYLVLVSPSRAKKIIREFDPDLVIGTGGYVCWPLLYAAASMGVPCMVHESNALPGVAVRQLQKKVDVILTNFKETEKLLKAKDRVVNVGNPLRRSCGALTREQACERLGIDPSKQIVLSFGGSLGA